MSLLRFDEKLKGHVINVILVRDETLLGQCVFTDIRDGTGLVTAACTKPTVLVKQWEFWPWPNVVVPQYVTTEMLFELAVKMAQLNGKITTLHTHPRTEAKLFPDHKHVIIDKAVFDQLVALGFMDQTDSSFGVEWHPWPPTRDAGSGQ